VTDSNINNKTDLKPELLSPVGDEKSLRAAVLNGADAVYLGVQDFNARINADNFKLNDLNEAVKYCHSHGVRVYLTLNILVKNSEMQEFLSTLSRSYSAGIDGVIIQHYSLIEVIKDNFPDLAVFISTQGAVCNTYSASLLKKADRIILPREMPLTEVRRMVDKGFNVEVFVHGALCFSYSGLCLFSSFVSNRSGNRGRCAQICRQKFNDTYLMSTKELCLAGRIPELLKAGVAAFKVEGRMRSPLYVAAATRLYRKAIDSCLAGEYKFPQEEMNEMEVVFNREFTEGLIFGDDELISAERPNNRGAYLGKIEGGEIILKRDVSAGDGIGIRYNGKITGGRVLDIIKDDRKLDSACKGEKVDLRIGAKDGSEIYITSSDHIKIEPDSEYKNGRKPVVNAFRKQVNVRLPRIDKRQSPPLQRFMAKVYSLSEAKEAAQSQADIVFYDIFAGDFPAPGQWRERTAMGAYIPRIINDSDLEKAAALCSQKKPAAVLTGNIGLLSYRSKINVPVYLDYSVNTFNDLDVRFLKKYDAVPVVSPELSMTEIASLRDREVVIMCHGDIVLMNTMIELKDEKLIDDKGLVFPVRKEHKYWQVLNSMPFGIFKDIKKIRSIGFNQFLIDQQGKSPFYILQYRKMLKQEVTDRNMRRGYTSGHLYKSV
jgi:collagenase-like PrtC family protease